VDQPLWRIPTYLSADDADYAEIFAAVGEGDADIVRLEGLLDGSRR